MDFHSLSRKELQALCKKNKIPANIASAAMVDALQNLQIVEGLDEILNQSQIDHPVSPVGQKTGSLEIPQSTTRTTTRRKPAIVEPQTEQLGTRSRRAPRREISKEMDQIETSVNLPETPAMPTTRRRAAAVSASQKSIIQMKKDEDVEKHDIKTPAVQNSSRKGPAVSTRRKVVETLNEGSVQRAYSTRRSVKLLENCMTGLSLQENIIEKPAEIDELVKEADTSEAKLQTSAEKESVKTFCSEPLIGRNLGESMEDEIDLEQTGSYKLADDQSVVEIEDSNQSEKIDEHAMNQEDGNLEIKEACEMVEADGGKETDNASLEAVESMKMEVEINSSLTDVEFIADEPINEITSPYVEKSISAQFPRPTFLAPTKSSSIKPLATQELTHDVTNINKENMDSSEMIVEQPEMMVMKKKTIDEDSLKNISMRKLIKMVKDMEISSKVGKSRTALQMLPENRMHVDEQEN